MEETSFMILHFDSSCYIGRITSCTKDLCYSPFLGITSDDGWFLNQDLFNHYVLIYLTKGAFFCEQHGSSFTLKPGEYLLLDKSIQHAYGFDENIPSEIHWMNMTGKLVRQLADSITSLTPLPLVSKNPKILEILDQSIRSAENHALDPYAHSLNILTALYTILHDISEPPVEKEYSPEEVDFRKRVDEILFSADLHTLTLDSFCTQMCMNKYYFAHQFKKYYAQSPIKYVLTFKINKAKNLLQYSNMKIVSIAQECGFTSSTYFSTYFRSECGISPEEYRKQCQKNPMIP